MKLSRIKHYIKLYMPYKWVLEYEEKHDFLSDYFKWKDSGKCVEFDKKCKWQGIVSVTGFGYTGSGAVVDLLREYDDCLVHGMAEGGSKATPAADDLGEITIVKNTGGLMDIDAIIGEPSILYGDGALKRFAKMVVHSTFYHRGTQYRDYIYKFFDSLIEEVSRNIPGSTASIMPRIVDNIFIIADINKQQYYQLCQQFLASLFNVQYNGKYPNLVLDQLVPSQRMDFKYNCNFIPNLKNIAVYRDPRDVYTIAKELDVQWIAHDTVEHFIIDMKRRYSQLQIGTNDYLVIRFEDLILDYDNTVAKIEKYLNLGEHKRPQSCLDTSISCKNIGMWKTATDIPAEDYEKILAAMPEYCYTK